MSPPTNNWRLRRTRHADGEDNKNKQYIPDLMMIDCSWSKKHLL